MTDTKFYADVNGIYLGGFSEGDSHIPSGAVEVSGPPLEAEGYTWSGSAWVATKAYLINYLAEYRWSKEVDGVTVSGVLIRTDDRSKMLLAAIQPAIQYENNSSRVRKIKTLSGFIELSNAQLAGIYMAVVGHVQKCFDAEYATLVKVNNDTLTTVAGVEAEFNAQYNA